MRALICAVFAVAYMGVAFGFAFAITYAGDNYGGWGVAAVVFCLVWVIAFFCLPPTHQKRKRR